VFHRYYLFGSVSARDYDDKTRRRES
jgi:hypothetical protein